MEWEWETYIPFVDPALRIFEQLFDELPQYPPHLKNSILAMRLDLRFLKMFFWGLNYWEESEDYWHLRFVSTTMGHKLRKTAKEFGIMHFDWAADGEKIKKWEQSIHYFEERIKQFKPQTKEICIRLLDGAFKCKYCQHEEMFFEYGRDTASFIDLILQNLEALNSKSNLIASVKQQISFIIGKLKMFGKFTYPVNHLINRIKNLGELLSHTRTWASHISCLACLYWIDGMDASLASTMGTMLSDLMHKTMPYTPEVIALYLDVHRATRFHKSESTVIPLLFASYVDFLLEDMIIPVKNDIEILREGLIFLLSFAVDPPNEHLEERELILGQIYLIISEVPCLICSIHFDEMKTGNSETQFSDFLQKVAGVKAEVMELYVMTNHSSQFNSPRTNSLGCLSFLLRNLKKMLGGRVKIITLIKHQVKIVQEELSSLGPFLENTLELENEEGKLKDLRTRIINLVYYATYATNLCSSTSSSIWYGVICLPNVIKEINLIKNEVKEIEDHQANQKKMLSAEMESSNALMPQVMSLQIEGAFIGFEKDVRSIRDQLVGGQKYLTIISISGMPGQGKTTLAKKLYNDHSIQYYFHKMVWCYVSKECKTRELLINILCRVLEGDEKVDVKALEIQDLIERIRKKLKGKKYLIVMDDIWDVDVWHKVQGSFPDDKNGSRIMFTSRNHDLPSQAKPNSISYPLRLYSEEESWELMKEKLFSNDNCPPEFLEIGKQIATYCKGLPLAVALIASLLKKTARKLNLWNQVAENLKSHLASEGCMHIIDLSYKYLSNHLKPCFLYFGAFPRGKSIRAKKLKLLWIAEGFIEENEMRCSEDLASEYLDNLVSQSLVVVTERSSMGGIKKCDVHDLLFDLCLERAVEDNFLHWADKSIVVDQCYSSPQKYSHHRLCIGTSDPFITPRPICSRKELPTSQVHSILFSHPGDSSRQKHEYHSYFLKSFKVLTVLDLEGMFLGVFKFPEVILSIIHLRHLALNARIGHIPTSIADLWNLQTFILIRGYLLEDQLLLPDTMWKMKSLRRVHISCFSLDLEYFDQNNSYMVACNIETLCGLVLHYDPQAVEFLTRLPWLRKLHCCFEKFHPMWFSMFGSLRKLEKLRIDRKVYHDELDKFLSFNFPENLTKLTLEGLRLPWSAMSTIGKQLPRLEVLKLLELACQGTRWDLEDGEFSKLRFLKLSGLDILQINLSRCDGPFPCLEELVVDYCERLEEIPSSFGDICTLNTINVFRCFPEVSESARRILEQQRDMGNLNLQVRVHHSLALTLESLVVSDSQLQMFQILSMSIRRNAVELPQTGKP